MPEKPSKRLGPIKEPGRETSRLRESLDRHAFSGFSYKLVRLPRGRHPSEVNKEGKTTSDSLILRSSSTLPIPFPHVLSRRLSPELFGAILSYPTWNYIRQAVAQATFKKDRRVNIRISGQDLEALQKRAIEEGIPYQTLIASLLHKYVSGRLVEKAA